MPNRTVSFSEVKVFLHSIKAVVGKPLLLNWSCSFLMWRVGSLRYTYEYHPCTPVEESGGVLRRATSWFCRYLFCAEVERAYSPARVHRNSLKTVLDMYSPNHGFMVSAAMPGTHHVLVIIRVGRCDNILRLRLICLAVLNPLPFRSSKATVYRLHGYHLGSPSLLRT